MALRATVAFALSALFLALVVTDSHAGFFDLWDAKTQSPDVTTANPLTASGVGDARDPSSSNRGRIPPYSSPKANRTDVKPTITVSVYPPEGHSPVSRNGSRGEGRGGRGRGRHDPSKPNATIAVVVPSPASARTVPKAGTEPPRVVSAPSPASPPLSAAPVSQVPDVGGAPQSVLMKTPWRLEHGGAMVTVDVPASHPELGEATSLYPRTNGLPGATTPFVWGPYPSELNTQQYGYPLTGQNQFSYGYHPYLPPWWSSRHVVRPRSAWPYNPMPQMSYHPWNPYSYYGGDSAAMASPYNSVWSRGRRESLEEDSSADDYDSASASSSAWYGSPSSSYYGNSNNYFPGNYGNYGYGNWPSYPYGASYAYPWGQFSAPWGYSGFQGSAPLSPPPSPPGSDAAAPGDPPPPPPPPPADAHKGATADDKHAHGGLQQPHAIRHQKHRRPPPSWQLPQVQPPRPAFQQSLYPMASGAYHPQSPPAHAAAPPPPPPPPPPAQEVVPYHSVV